VTPPAVLGIQAAEQPPRYVAVSKVRQAMKSSSIEERTVAPTESPAVPHIGRMFKPEAAQHAIMLAGAPDEIAGKLVKIFKEIGVI
jgi:electron transfer flavoprotein alpha/beta subunit